MLRVSRALELRIKLQVEFQVDLWAQGGDPLGPPPRQENGRVVGASPGPFSLDPLICSYTLFYASLGLARGHISNISNIIAQGYISNISNIIAQGYISNIGNILA